MGRVVHLQPMRWQEDWPVIGVDIDRNGIGEPVYVWKKPAIKGIFNISAPQSDDDFNSVTPGLQWQWNHNPVKDLWSMAVKPGYLSLTASKSENFIRARNTITQKVMGTTGEVVTEMDVTGMAAGQKAGLCSMGGRNNNLVGIIKKESSLFVFVENNGKIVSENQFTGKKIYLKAVLDIRGNNNQFFFSTDNKKYNPIGETFITSAGYWKGNRIGLYSYNEKNDGGIASFNWFTYYYDGPKGK